MRSIGLRVLTLATLALIVATQSGWITTRPHLVELAGLALYAGFVAVWFKLAREDSRTIDERWAQRWTVTEPNKDMDLDEDEEDWDWREGDFF